MNCPTCGAVVDDAEKKCPNCGAPLEKEDPIIELEPGSPAEAPEPVTEPEPDPPAEAPEPIIKPESDPPAEAPEPITEPEPGSPAEAPEPITEPEPDTPAKTEIETQDALESAAAQVKTDFAAAQAKANTYQSDILGEAVTVNPNDIAKNPSKPKKPHHTRNIILIIVIIVVVVAAVCGGIFGGRNASDKKHCNEVIDSYWKAYVDGDAEGVLASIPDAYWTYIAETYGYTQDECLAGVESLIDQTYASLGGNLTWSDTRENFSSSKTGTDGVAELLEDYGLIDDVQRCAGYTVTADLTGDTSTQTFDSNGMWAIKIDGQWYDLTAMNDIDTLCAGGYMDEAAYGKVMQTFWVAFYNQDVDTIAELVPEATWDFLAEYYGASSQKSACDSLAAYLADAMAYSGISDRDTVSFDLFVTGTEDCSQEEVDDYNLYLSEDLQATAFCYVDFDAVMSVDYADEALEDESMEDTASSIMMRLSDGHWYLYDAIYYFATACYYYPM